MHPNEFPLLWQKPEGTILPTGDHRRLSKLARKLGKPYEQALAEQVARQELALVKKAS